MIKILKFLKDVSFNNECFTAFQSDPKGFLDRYETLTDNERALILSGNSAAVTGYLLNPDGFNSDESGNPEALYIIVGIVVFLVVGLAGLDFTKDDVIAQHKAYWSDVTERTRQFAH